MREDSDWLIRGGRRNLADVSPTLKGDVTQTPPLEASN